MPTNHDESPHERYHREHTDHLARLAKMTPGQVAEMELSLHNALAEADKLRAQNEAMRSQLEQAVLLLKAWQDLDVKEKPQ